MEFTDYIRILRKRWWIIIVAVVLTAGCAFLFAKLQHPLYTSTVEIVMEPARPEWGLGQATQMLLRSYMTVIDSDQYAQRVIDRLQLSMTAQQLRNDAHFATAADRMVIRLEIESYDPDQANHIARTWANLLVEWRDSQNQEQNKADRVFAYLRDEPDSALTWPKTRTITLAGAVFGLVIAGVLIVFLEWIEGGVIRTPRDVAQGLKMMVVGAIPPSK